MKKAKKTMIIDSHRKIDWDIEDADFLGWDEAPHQGTYWAKGEDDKGNRYSGYLTIVYFGHDDQEVVDIEDIEPIYEGDPTAKTHKFPIQITDDSKYDPKQVHMVTGQELLAYLVKKGKKNNE